MEARVTKELQTKLSIRAFGTAVVIDNTVHEQTNNNQNKNALSILVLQ